MKTEQLIVQYLYSNKKMSLQDIGTFTMADVHIDTENDKDVVLPADAIQFHFDQKAPVDDGLITYIMQHTRKIRPLAASDLESFIMLNRQFLNIGKPLIIEGIGTLQKTQAGEYAFTQSGTSHFVQEDLPKALTEKQKDDVSFATQPRPKKYNGMGAPAAVFLLLILAGISIAAWYFIRKHQRETAASENTMPVVTDTSAGPVVDSAATKKMQDSLAAAAKPAAPVNAVKDTNSFYIVVVKEFSNHKAAQKSFDNFASIGYRPVLSMTDSLHYQYRFPFKRALADTVHLEDSLSKFFSSKVHVELPH